MKYRKDITNSHPSRQRAPRRLVVALATLLLLAAVPSVARAADDVPRRVTTFGNARDFGEPSSTQQPVVGIASTVTGNGYWMVASDGGVFSYGDARFYGSLGSVHLNQPIIGITRTVTGQGYWLFARDGGVFSFGDAQFFGSTGGVSLNQPISAMFATPSGQGYWLVALDGGVFTFGDATFHGSAANFPDDGSVISGFATSTGRGYTLVTSTGNVYDYGDAVFEGDILRGSADSPIVEATSTPDNSGYWLLAKDGAVFSFGSAHYFGGANGVLGNRSAISLVSTVDANGYYVISGDENQAGAGGRFVGTFSATCYSLGGHTASGAPVGDNVVASDPRVLPLGTHIYIEGVGYRTALDTGGAIKGSRLDIWRPTASECTQFGRQRLKVWVL